MNEPEKNINLLLFMIDSIQNFVIMTLNRSLIHTLVDALPCLINNEFLADVKFQFPDDQIIYAHSFIMCLRSDEFYEEFKSTIGIIKLIPVADVSYGAFVEFLRYLYLDVIDVSYANVHDLMKLSVRYGIKDLEKLCITSLTNDLDENNVCMYLNTFLNEKPLEIQSNCKDFIAHNYSRVLNSPSFLDVNDKVLKCILNLEPVSDVEEFKIFQSTIKWAIRRSCKNNDNELVDGKTLRTALGENIKCIRFGAMSAEEFANAQKIAPGLLQNDECNAIFMNILTKATNSFGFSNQKRRKIVNFDLASLTTRENGVISIPFTRYTLSKTTDSDKSVSYFIDLMVNKPIKLKSLKFAIQEFCELSLTIYENKKEIFKKNFSKPARIAPINFAPVAMQPRKFYRIQYELKVFGGQTIHKYEADGIAKCVNYNVDNENIEFKFFKMHSQIRCLTFDC